jgi:hypothetical protein
MTEHPDHTDPGSERVRRVLKQSRRIKASSDFEERLLRRIARESSSRGGTARTLFPRRVPAYAFSLLALAIVGVLSYYMFIRPPLPPPAGDGGPPAPRDALRTLPNDREPSGPGSATPPTSAPRTGEGTPTRRETRPAPVPAEESSSGEEGREKRKTESPAEILQKKEMDLPAVGAPTLPEQTAPVKSSGGRERDAKRDAAPPAVLQQDENLEMAAPAVSAPPLPAGAAATIRSVQQSGLVSAPGMTADSARRLDSLKAVSVHPIDTLKHLPLRKPKRPRP